MSLFLSFAPFTRHGVPCCRQEGHQGPRPRWQGAVTTLPLASKHAARRSPPHHCAVLSPCARLPLSCSLAGCACKQRNFLVRARANVCVFCGHQGCIASASRCHPPPLSSVHITVATCFVLLCPPSPPNSTPPPLLANTHRLTHGACESVVFFWRILRVNHTPPRAGAPAAVDVTC